MTEEERRRAGDPLRDAARGVLEMGRSQSRDRRNVGMFFGVVAIVLAIVLVGLFGQYRNQAAQFAATQQQIVALRANHVTDQALIAQDQTLIARLGQIVSEQSGANASLADQLRATNDDLQKVIADDVALRRQLAALHIAAPVPPVIVRVPAPTVTVTVTPTPKCTRLLGLGC